MSKIKERINQILKEWEKDLEKSSWNWNPNTRELCLEFRSDPNSEVGFGEHHPTSQVYFNIRKHEEDGLNEFHEEVKEAKPKIFEKLERMARIVYRENTNNDPRSFEHTVDTCHEEGVVDFQVSVTDSMTKEILALNEEEKEFLAGVLETQGFEYISQEASILRTVVPWEEAQSRTKKNLVLLRELLQKLRT